jgi:uncharacterized protein
MYLVDTNIWLERLLGQARAAEAGGFLDAVEGAELAMSEFSLYSIGILLCRLGREDAFEDFLSDTLEDSAVQRVCLDVEGLGEIVQVRRRFSLDFDDAYQYVAATKLDATIISFDKDFDRTDRGRKTPGEALRELLDGRGGGSSLPPEAGH